MKISKSKNGYIIKELNREQLEVIENALAVWKSDYIEKENI